MQLKSFIRCLLALVIVFCNRQAVAELHVITENWVGYTNKDQTGLYFELLKKGLPEQSFKTTFVPWQRARKSFEKGGYDVLLGETVSMPYCRYPKWPIDIDIFGAFYNKEKISLPEKNQNFKKYKVVFVRGYDLEKLVPGLKNYEEVNDIDEGVMMITRGRADIFIDYTFDLIDLIKSKSIDAQKYVVATTQIPGELIHACFSSSQDHLSQIKAFDVKMQKMYDSGELAQIFGKYNRSTNLEKMLIKMGRKPVKK